MFPIFGGLFGGLLGASFLSGGNRFRLEMPKYQWFRNGRNVNSTPTGGILDNDDSRYYKSFMTDYKFSNQMYEFIKIYEGFDAKASDKKDGYWTIGHGTIAWRDEKGVIIRYVKQGDTITQAEAVRQLRLYYESGASDVKKRIDNFIRQNGLKIHQRFYDMYLQVHYMSAGFHRRTIKGKVYNYGEQVLRSANGITNVHTLANMLSKKHIEYLKNMTSTYHIHGLGWSRRIYAYMNYIIGNDIWKNQAQINRLVKNRY